MTTDSRFGRYTKEEFLKYPDLYDLYQSKKEDIGRGLPVSMCEAGCVIMMHEYESSLDPAMRARAWWLRTMKRLGWRNTR